MCLVIGWVQAIKRRVKVGVYGLIYGTLLPFYRVENVGVYLGKSTHLRAWGAL